jgi:ATP-binding protein involved in chromosome partitioning
MFERVNVPVVGIIENMSGFICPGCGARHELFSTGGGQRLADEVGTPLLGQVPLQARLADEADAGRPVVLAQPESPAARAIVAIAEGLGRRLGGRPAALPILRG